MRLCLFERPQDDLAAHTSPGEVVALHVGYHDWPGCKEQPWEACCGPGPQGGQGGAPPPMDRGDYERACAVMAGGLTRDAAKSKVVGLVLLGQSWRSDIPSDKQVSRWASVCSFFFDVAAHALTCSWRLILTPQVRDGD